MRLSEFVYHYRQEHGLSMRQFAEKCGKNMNHVYIHMIEHEENPQTGKPLNPSIPKLKLIAHGMNMTLQELFDSVDDMDVEMMDEYYADDSFQQSSKDTELYDALQRLDEKNKTAVLEIIKVLQPDD